MQANVNLRSEFLSVALNNLSEEEKALRKGSPSNAYIDMIKYIEWLEYELTKTRLEVSEKS